jgi:hypothetical protein
MQDAVYSTGDMSRLRVGDDDHPQAATKHLADSRALIEATRFDGSAYLAGYVVECALKAVLLHDRSFDPSTGTTDQAQLIHWHRELTKPRLFGHDLVKLLAANVGPVGAKYLPGIPPTASVLRWRETLRYRASGTVDRREAEAYLGWAEVTADEVVQMELDGVL